MIFPWLEHWVLFSQSEQFVWGASHCGCKSSFRAVFRSKGCFAPGTWLTFFSFSVRYEKAPTGTKTIKAPAGEQIIKSPVRQTNNKKVLTGTQIPDQGRIIITDLSIPGSLQRHGCRYFRFNGFSNFVNFKTIRKSCQRFKIDTIYKKIKTDRSLCKINFLFRFCGLMWTIPDV